MSPFGFPGSSNNLQSHFQQQRDNADERFGFLASRKLEKRKEKVFSFLKRLFYSKKE
jgi:hypothetical protein